MCGVDLCGRRGLWTSYVGSMPIYLELSFLIFLPSVKVIKRAQCGAACVMVSWELDVTITMLLAAVYAWVTSEENFASDPRLASLQWQVCCLHSKASLTVLRFIITFWNFLEWYDANIWLMVICKVLKGLFNIKKISNSFFFSLHHSAFILTCAQTWLLVQEA